MLSDQSNNEPASKRPRLVLTINLRDQTCHSKHENYVSDLPANDDPAVHVACKQGKNVTTFHEKTAGVMFIICPCGIVIDWREMFTCESPSQLFVQLLKLYDQDIDPNVKYVGYDRA